MSPYDVLYEKDGEFVAQLKFSVLLLKSGPNKVTAPLFDPTTAKSALALKDEGVLALLAQSAAKKKSGNKKKKTKKPAGAAEGAAAGGADEDGEDGEDDA